MLSGTVPVYLGTDTIGKLLPSEKAVVKISDFPSGPQQLAVFLKSVGNDEQKYNSLMSWKANPSQNEIDTFQEIIDSTAYKFTSLCRICERLATDIPIASS